MKVKLTEGLFAVQLADKQSMNDKRAVLAEVIHVGTKVEAKVGDAVLLWPWAISNPIELDDGSLLTDRHALIGVVQD